MDKPIEYDTVEQWIESENGHQPSSDDQKYIYKQMFSAGYLDSEDNPLRTSSLKEKYRHQTTYNLDQVLGNLEEIGVLSQIEPRGSGTFVANERLGRYFHSPSNREFIDCFEEERDRLIDDMESINRDGAENTAEPIADGSGKPTRRKVVADTLSVAEENVEEELTSPDDIVDQMEKFDEAVKAIEEHEDVEKDGEYGRMGWRNAANRWAVSELAERVDRNERLT